MSQIHIARFFMVLLFLLNLCQTFASKHYTNSLYLDPGENYFLAWAFDDEKIDFLVRANTNGYVGFGISPYGDMRDSDMVIGGVQNGRPYFGDYYALQNDQPIRDDIENWNLTSSQEIDGQTILKFWRNRVTGDNLNDNNITDKKTDVIWAYGMTDDIYYHGDNRGSKRIALLELPTQVEEPTTIKQATTPTQQPETDAPNTAPHWRSRVINLFLFAIIFMFI